MTISTWSKLAIASLGLFVMGQTCSINIGTGTGADGGIFRSIDHGATWQQKVFVSATKKRTVSLKDVSVRILTTNPSDANHLYLGTLANGVWQSMNRGDQWQPTSIRAGAYDCLSFDPTNPKIMYTASGQNVLKSTDGGVRWLTVYTEAQPGHLVNCVYVNPVNGNEVWTTTGAGKVIRSDDYGNTWTLRYTSPTPIEPRLMYTPSDTPSVLYIINKTTGILRSDNHGATWTVMNPALAAFPGGTDIRQAIVVKNTWYLATTFGLLKSIDRGANWSSIPILVNNGSVAIQNVAVNPRNQSEIFITTNQRLHHTVDGGASWSVSTLPTTRLPVQLQFDPLNPDTLYFGAFQQPKK